jgi:hypothetical protein
MSTPPTPLIGQMYLYDYMEPPLLDHSYRLRVSTESTSATGTTSYPVPEAISYFDVIGPRFRVSPAQVAGAFPPRNGHGDFTDALPHIALYDRTLPWERNLDPNNKTIHPPTIPNGVTPGGTIPWLALLLFEEGEYTLQQNVALENVLPSTALHSLGLSSPTAITCDALQVDSSVFSEVLPNLDELALLAHVRQVNVEDRELSAGSSNGWFSVVMSNRMPAANAKYRACLVSLEGRLDLYNPSRGGIVGNLPVGTVEVTPRGAGLAASTAEERLLSVQPSRNAARIAIPSDPRRTVLPIKVPIQFHTTISVVLLYSWQFECIGTGTFRELAQNLDVSMMGSTAAGKPAVTDTGHIAMQVGDRSGAQETAWYRGPLVPLQLTRDPLGPYHSADQARIATPETGGEDVSYAAAFEVGRLMAAADARLAQELMRWRRNAFSASTFTASLATIQSKLPTLQPLDIHSPVSPLLMHSASEKMVGAIGPLADPYRMRVAALAPGLNLSLFQSTFGVSQTEAKNLLGGEAGVLGSTVAVPAETPRPDTSLAAVAADSAGLSQLSEARARLVENATTKLGSA